MKIRRVELIKLPRLLNMLYRPGEIAEELGVTAETVTRSWLPAGAPFDRDKTGNIWIHGTTFAAWVTAVSGRGKDIRRLADGEGFCFKCAAAVLMIRPRQRHLGRYTSIWQGKCPTCGGKVNRAYTASGPGGEEAQDD